MRPPKHIPATICCCCCLCISRPPPGLSLSSFLPFSSVLCCRNNKVYFQRHSAAHLSEGLKAV